MPRIALELPIKTVSESNVSEHWSKKAQRHKQQQWMIRIAFNQLEEPVQLPCTVKLTRLSPRMLDSHDNLPMAFKWIVDQLSECLIPQKPGNGKGRSDSDPRITWLYDQRKESPQRILIEISH